jgi:hypothetical protein
MRPVAPVRQPARTRRGPRPPLRATALERPRGRSERLPDAEGKVAANSAYTFKYLILRSVGGRLLRVGGRCGQEEQGEMF